MLKVRPLQRGLLACGLLCQGYEPFVEVCYEAGEKQVAITHIEKLADPKLKVEWYNRCQQFEKSIAIAVQQRSRDLLDEIVRAGRRRGGGGGSSSFRRCSLALVQESPRRTSSVAPPLALIDWVHCIEPLPARPPACLPSHLPTCHRAKRSPGR